MNWLQAYLDKVNTISQEREIMLKHYMDLFLAAHELNIDDVELVERQDVIDGHIEYTWFLRKKV